VGLFTDKRFQAFAADPASVTGTYAVADGHLVNFISFDPGPTPAWNEFLDQYLAANHGPELSASCDGPDASGEACATAVISHLEDAAAAWAVDDGRVGPAT
jgi:protein involved in temperature-dependent protein secretion